MMSLSPRGKVAKKNSFGLLGLPTTVVRQGMEAAAKKVLVEKAKGKKKLVVEDCNVKKKLNDLKSKLDRKTKDHSSVQKNMTQLRAKYANVVSQLSEAVSERGRLATEKKDLEAEIRRLHKDIGDYRNKYEQKALACADFEKKLKRKQEEFKFRDELHENNIVEMRTQHRMELQKMERRLTQEYAENLAGKLREVREEFDARWKEYSSTTKRVQVSHQDKCVGVGGVEDDEESQEEQGEEQQEHRCSIF